MAHVMLFVLARRGLMMTGLAIVVSATSAVAQTGTGGGTTTAPTPPATLQTPAPTGPALQISMEDAVTMALETNLGLKSGRLNVDMAAQNVAAARAAFRPVLNTAFSRNTASSVPSDFSESAARVVSSSFLQFGSTMRQTLPWYGGAYSVNWTASRSETTGISTFNPSLRSGLTLQFTQPLWRNFRVDGARLGLESSERQQQITDLGLQQQILQTSANVRSAYLGLIGARAGRDVANLVYSQAEESLRQARARIAVGAAAEIDAIQSEANLKSNEESVIVAESRVSTAEDQLRALILDPMRPDYWALQIVPTEPMEVTRREIDVNAAIQNALANRLDATIARQQVLLTDLNLKLDEDQVRPGVDFQATYVASGTGGTQFVYGAGVPPPVISQTERSFVNALGDAFGGAYPSWTVGVNVNYPIGLSAAQASLTRARIQRRQQEIDLRNLELQITTQVRDAARQVETNYRRVQTTQAALEANLRQLDAEQRKFAVGLSTTFEVLQKQTLLASARTAELQARIQYNQSLIDFERVQRIR